MTPASPHESFLLDHREYLHHELSLRQNRNPRYSLRAYAKDLGLSASTLCELLAGKHGLSHGRALLVARRIPLADRHAEHFADLVVQGHSRNPAKRKLAKLRVSARVKSDEHRLSLEKFQVIADWHHLALLELTYLKDFSPEPAWIARALGITVSEVHIALRRLEDVGLIERRGGQIFVREDNTKVGEGVPADAVRRFHTQLLGKATKAIHEQRVSERELSSTIFSLRAADFPKIQARLRRFAAELTTEFAAGPARDSIYCLALQCFSLRKDNQP
jgi:uncharacterized protein (TIGR02147 family)